MKMKKSLLLIIIMGLFLVGCERTTRINIRNAAVEDLNKRYNENFEYAANYEDQFGASYDSFYLESKDVNSPVYGKYIYVMVENYKSDNYTIRDNYLAMKYEKQTEDYITQKVHKYFNSANIYYTCEKKSLCKTSFLNTGLNSNTSFDEFLKNTNQFNIELFAKIELKESEFYDRKLLDDLTNEIDINYFYFDYYIMKDERFGTIKRDDFGYYIDHDYSIIKYLANTSGKDGKKVVNIYREDILTQKYKKETERYILDIARQNYSELELNKWRSFSAHESYDLDLNATFDEYLRNRDVAFTINFKVRKSDYSREKFDNIVNKFVEDGLEFYLYLYVIEDSEFEERETSSSYIRAIKYLNEEVDYYDRIE